MQSQIETDYKKAVIARSAHLALSARRVMDLAGSTEQSLGESSRRTLLAAACPRLTLNELSHDDVKHQVEILFDSAIVISATARSAVILLGDVVCFAGMYGVVTFSLPLLDWPLNKTSFSRHSIIDASALLERIGAFYDGHQGADSLYNYSNCKIGVKGMLNA